MKTLSNFHNEHQNKKPKNPAEILEILQDVLVPLFTAVANAETGSPRRPGRPRLTLPPKEIIDVLPQNNENIQQQMSEPDLEDKITDLYAKGLTTRDITNHLKDMHGIELSTSSISAITDKVLPFVKEWQARPLSSQYPILYMDGIWFKVKDSGKIISKCAYIALGINVQGHKEVLGIWIAENEGAKFWLQVLTEIKNRGVESVLIACVDGLRGFPDAIKTVYPEAVIQVCVIHQVRHTIKYVSHKDRKGLRKICGRFEKYLRCTNGRGWFSGTRRNPQKMAAIQFLPQTLGTTMDGPGPIFFISRINSTDYVYHQRHRKPQSPIP